MFNYLVIIITLKQLTEQVSCCWVLNHWSPKNDNRLLQRLKMSRGNLCAKNQMFFLFYNILFICALASHWTLNVEQEPLLLQFAIQKTDSVQILSETEKSTKVEQQDYTEPYMTWCQSVMWDLNGSIGQKCFKISQCSVSEPVNKISMVMSFQSNPIPSHWCSFYIFLFYLLWKYWTIVFFFRKYCINAKEMSNQESTLLKVRI